MQESFLNQLDPAWKNVLLYFEGLDSDWKREMYLQNLSSEQKDYLLSIYKSFEKVKSEKVENQENQENQQFNFNSQNKEEFTLNKRSDSHTLSKKKYESSKNKNFIKRIINGFLALLPALIIAFVFFNPQAKIWASQNIPFLNQGIQTEAKLITTGRTAEYDKWMKSYVGEFENIEIDKDFDKDGLSNLEEYNLGTNPENPDSNKNGRLDGQDILDSIDPLNSKFINKAEKSTIEKIVNKDKLIYRLQILALAEIKKEDESINAQDYALTVDNISTTENGFLSVPALGIESAPISWKNSTVENFNENFLLSLLHYSETNLPANTSSSYIFGNNEILKTSDETNGLNLLKPGDVVYINIKTQDGEEKNLEYLVTTQNIYDPSDPAQFDSKRHSELSLSTPLHFQTSSKVLVVKSRLIKITNILSQEVKDGANQDNQE